MEDIPNTTSYICSSLTNIKKEALINLLRCSLCNGIFRTPTTINECMHSFCKGCIYKWFYEVSPIHDHCPLCQIKLSGRPLETLIFDTSLSLLVEILFPEFNEIDKVNTEKMYKAFREYGEPLLDDPEKTDIYKPKIKVYLQPMKTKDPKLYLPEIEGQILVSKLMTIQYIKQYINHKLQRNEDIIISYKNQEMPSHYTFDEIDQLYVLDNKNTILYYSKKSGNS